MGKLKFIFGPSGSGKTTKVYDEVLMRAQEEPGRNFLVIVPDQFTMQTQRELSKRSATGGILNIDVLSFGRLTHRIMTEVGWKELPVLDDTGKCLVLQRVAGRITDKTPVLGRRMSRQGYIHEVKSVISEFMQYGMSPSDIEKLTEETGRGGALGSKLADLSLIYKEFLAYIADSFITREEKLDILRQIMPYSKVLSDSVVVFDGFTGFTPIQLGVIEDILKIADETIVTLLLGEDKKIEECNQMEDLFYLSGKTYEALTKRAKDITLLPAEYVNYKGRAPEIEFIEKKIFRSAKTEKYDPEKVEVKKAGTEKDEAEKTAEKVDEEKKAGEKVTVGAVSMFRASTIAEEAHQAGLEIYRLLEDDKDLQFRDIALVAGDLESYAPYLERELSGMNIPYYIDRTDSIRLNPLIEGVRSVIALFLKDFSAEAVMRYLRSGISGVDCETADRLELYIRETGIRGYKAWSNRFARKTREMDPKDEEALTELDNIREEFFSRISVLFTDESGRITPLKAGTKLPANIFVNRLYDFLLSIKAAEKMAEYASNFEKEGDPVRQKEYGQIYRKLLELLEQIESLMGEDEISFKEFGEILDAGFGEIRIGTIPQTVDKILIGDIERTRVPAVKVLFFVGVSDGNIPKNTDKGGIISDLEREDLRERGFELAPTPREEMYNQRLYLYMNMTKPSERLYISWAALEPSGKSLRPSYLCEEIRRMFPYIKVREPEKEKKTRQIVSRQEGLRYLGEELRLFAEGAKGDDTVYTLYSAYGDEECRDKRERLFNAAFYRYEPKLLDRHLAKALYCDEDEEAAILRSSVSQLETYALCPYKFFLKYGLKLKEDIEFGIDNRDTGNVFHEVLELFSKKLKEDSVSWRDFTEEYAKKAIEEILEQVTDIYAASVFQDTARNRQNIHRLKRALVASVLSVRYQVKKGRFEPRAFEVPFRQDMDMEEKDGVKRKLRLRGKIDRVDLADENGRVYVRIVDYKSSKKQFRPGDIIDGKQLQLPLYLKQETEVLRENGQDACPAGMLYYHVDDPVVEADANACDEDVSKIIRESRVMKGFTREDDTIIYLNDAEVETTGGKSDVIKVSYKAKGGLSESSETLINEDFDTLMEYCEFIAKKKAGEILDGNISIKPAEGGSCEFCEYKNSCSFDKKIWGYEKQASSKVSKKDMIPEMRSRMNNS